MAVARYSSGFEQLGCLAAQYTPGRVEELTGISKAELELLAREYAMAKPAIIRLNYGVQRSDRGGSAVRAIAALPVITGSWRSAGGGLQLTTSGAFEFNTQSLEQPELQFASPLGRMSRGRVPGLRAWTSGRALPAPARESFRDRWAREHR